MILNYCLSSFMRTNFYSKNYFINNLKIWKISDRNDKHKNWTLYMEITTISYVLLKICRFHNVRLSYFSLILHFNSNFLDVCVETEVFWDKDTKFAFYFSKHNKKNSAGIVFLQDFNSFKSFFQIFHLIFMKFLNIFYIMA